jgi:UDP-glucose 4-epimerase
MSKRILVIGGEGFIGRSLCEALLRGGYRVQSTSRSSTSVVPGGVARIRCDVRSPDVISPLLENCDFVVHLASASTPGSTAGRPLEEIEANLLPTLALLQAMQSHPFLPLLFLSSAGSLYAGRGTEIFTEIDEVQPRSYHGAGKAAAENFIGAWSRQFERSAVILRPSNVYGPGQQKRRGFGIVPHALGAILNEQPLIVWGDGSSARDYLYIEDLVALCLAIIGTEMAPGLSTFNAGSGVSVSLNELFECMERVTGRQLKRHYAPMRSVDAERVAVDSGLAQGTFGWRPRIQLAVGIERTWNWLRSNPQ